MKRLLKVLLVAMMTVTLVACGGSSVKAEVTNTQTKEVEMLTAKEIKKIDEDNSAKFQKYYAGAKIKFTGTVDSISTNTYVNGSGPYNIIEFKEGFELRVNPGKLDLGELSLADISAGDKFEVESTIYSTHINVTCGVNDYTTMKKVN